VVSNIKKLTILTLGLAALIGVGTLGVKAVSAQDSDYPPFIEGLSERFGLNQDEVKTFFDEQMEVRHDQMMEAKEDRLGQAVEDGVITEEQKEALLNKWEEMRQEREQERQEMQAWFEENGIDPEALRNYWGFGPRGMHPHMGM
jgi:hypothetical protein